VPDQHGLIEKAMIHKSKFGTEEAVQFLEKQGIPRELAVFALVGSRYSLNMEQDPGCSGNAGERVEEVHWLT